MKLQFGTVMAAAVLEQFARWLPARSDQLKRLAGKCRLGLEVELREIKPAHSDQARAYYWLSLHQFGKWLGYSPRETEGMIHTIVCAEAFGQAGAREITWHGRDFSWPVPAETSSKDADGRKRDAETYSELIECLIRVAAEQGFVVMPPQ